jgi:hypothetical protein
MFVSQEAVFDNAISCLPASIIASSVGMMIHFILDVAAVRL